MAIRQVGMDPMVTLPHFTRPVHVEERSEMAGEASAAMFEAYVMKLAEAMGGVVRYWITRTVPILSVVTLSAWKVTLNERAIQWNPHGFVEIYSRCAQCTSTDPGSI